MIIVIVHYIIINLTLNNEISMTNDYINNSIKNVYLTF